MDLTPNLREEAFSLLCSGFAIGLHSGGVDVAFAFFFTFLAFVSLITAHGHHWGILGARHFSAPGIWSALFLCYILWHAHADTAALYRIAAVAFVVGTEALACRFGGRGLAWQTGFCATGGVAFALYRRGSSLAMLPSLAFFCLLPNFVLVSFKNTFSVGEAIIMVQCLVLGIGSDLWLPFSLSFFMSLKVLVEFWNSTFTLVLVSLTHILVYIFAFREEFLRNLDALFQLVTPQNVILTLIWGILLLFALSLVQLNQKSCPKTMTALRKVFHLLAAVVYITGILWSYDLLSLASAVILYVFLLLEILRQERVGFVGQLLDRYLEAFRDERDSGDMIFTPIALHLGLSLPLWIHQYLGDQSNAAVPWAGVISVAIGDTLGALVGQRFGSWKWPGSHRSFQGSAASWLGQVTLCAALLSADVIRVPIWRLLLAVNTNVFVEAYTSQIDNLLLPLCFIAFVL